MPTVDVRLVDVVKKFGEAVAVDHINLEVESGEFFALLGPSGCGKTTTLRMIGGFEAPTSGLIELKGQDVTWLPPYQRHVNTVFQNYALFPHLTVFENVAFGLRRSKVGDAEIKTRVTEMLKLVELPGYEGRKPTQISGGQAQRVALARALINRPAVLLLDEPLGALDLKLRKQMQVELKRIQQEVGITFIFVTHDQEEAMTMSDRIAVMNHGRYEQLGDPASLYERPKTRFVAGFLGVSNLLPTKPESSEGGYAISRLADGSAVRVPLALTEGLDAYEIGVRPEKVRLTELKDDVPPGLNQMLGTIRDASYLGVSTSYIVEARGGATITVYEQNVERATRAELWTPGEEVRMTWSPDHTFAVQAGGDPPTDVPGGPARRGRGGRWTPAGGRLPASLPGRRRARGRRGRDRRVPCRHLGRGDRTDRVEQPRGRCLEPAAAVRPAGLGGRVDPTRERGGRRIAPAGERRPPGRQLDRLYGCRRHRQDLPDPRQVHQADRDRRELPRGHRRQRGVLHEQPQGSARCRAADRLGHRRHDRLDDRPARPPELARGLRPRGDAQLRGQPAADLPRQVVRPGHALRRALAVGDDGPRLQPEEDRTADLAQVLFSDKYKGRMTYLDEMRDTVGLAALQLGFDPKTITEDQFQQSLALVANAVNQGWVRQVTGNSYVNTLQSGDAVMAIAWSGDVLTLLVPDQTKSQDFQWVLATEGGMLWTDNAAIPKGSPRRGFAQQWIDFYYDPANAAVLEAYVNYVCPVKGAREVMLTIDPDLANNPLIFPPEDWFARLHQFRATTADEEVNWAEAYTKVMGL